MRLSRAEQIDLISDGNVTVLHIASGRTRYDFVNVAQNIFHCVHPRGLECPLALSNRHGRMLRCRIWYWNKILRVHHHLASDQPATAVLAYQRWVFGPLDRTLVFLALCRLTWDSDVKGFSESRGSRPNDWELQRVKRKGNRMTAVSYRFPCQGMDKGALRLIEWISSNEVLGRWAHCRASWDFTRQG